MSALINTEEVSSHLRTKAIDLKNKKILITNFEGSLQEQDLSEPTNCKGYGRIRHFKLGEGNFWPVNPLPILPAYKALKLPAQDNIRAQVFQNSVCNWRCWYCFVDYNLLNGDRKHADFFSSEELVSMFKDQHDLPIMIDLTGGQPDLTPEWVPWMMESLKQNNLSDKVFLWSDDNLSNDYFWRFLTADQISLIQSYKLYSRVCCFKGIDENSFVLNTKASPENFEKQFEFFSRLLELKIDIYAYVTLTASLSTNFKYTIPVFLDRLQKISENLPLRTIPLEISEFSPVKGRMNATFVDMIKGQYEAIAIWKNEIDQRFPAEMKNKLITEIQL